jgi:uncharacterized protein YndB with AHSA1/START domain
MAEGGNMSSETLRFERAIKAPRTEVYRAFTRSVALREWLSDGAVVEARPGGHLYLWWHSGYYACGEFLGLDPEKPVAFTWQGRGEPGPTQVEVTFEEGDGGDLRVTVAHSGFGTGDVWDRVRAEAAQGWESGLVNLASVLETGQDLRYVRRPMLGVYLDEFTPEIAARLGVPTTEGTRLSGTVEGMGAQQAGLQKDDVLVAIAGQTVSDYPNLVAALGPYRAGDRVIVEFYRGAERRTAEMQLSGRVIPEVPPTPAALAEAFQEGYATSLSELERFLEGVGEAEASHRPAPGEWNTLEVLAHLIAHEREQQTWITDLVCDDERWSDRFENTEVVPARIAAIASAYPTLVQAVEALKRSQSETVHMLVALPAEFVAHRGTYWRLGRSMLEGLQPPNHLQEHTEQIQAAVASARAG